MLVVDAAGAPAARAEVAFTDETGSNRLGPSTTTDAAGVARLAPPAGRTANVRSRAERGDEVALGCVRDVPVSGEVLHLAAGVFLRGRVTGPDAAPVADAFVRACNLAPYPYRSFLTTRTGADGAFRLGPVPLDFFAEGVEVLAHAPGHSAWTERLDVDAARRGDLSIVLAPVRRVHGRCVTEQGEPVVKVQVTVRPGLRWMNTDDEGRFDLKFDSSATVSLVGFPEAHAAFSVSSPAARDGATDVGDIVLHAGGTVSGRVVDETGTGVFGASVTLVADGLGDVRSGQADEEGNFELTAVGDGLHSVLADQDSHGETPRHGRVAAVRAGASDVRVVVAPGRAIRLRVAAAEDGRPLEFQSYLLLVRRSEATGFDQGTWSDCRCGPRTWACVLVPTAGRYDVAFAVPGRRAATLRSVDVKDDEIATANVVLWKP